MWVGVFYVFFSSPQSKLIKIWICWHLLCRKNPKVKSSATAASWKWAFRILLSVYHCLILINNFIPYLIKKSCLSVCTDHQQMHLKTLTSSLISTSIRISYILGLLDSWSAVCSLNRFKKKKTKNPPGLMSDPQTNITVHDNNHWQLTVFMLMWENNIIMAGAVLCTPSCNKDHLKVK